jgi:large subunit ribosomal protein L33
LTALGGRVYCAALWEPSMRDLFHLRCEDCGRDNYVTNKNKRTMPDKFKIKKFCNACRKHTMHKEQKISKG